jgi:hypothetical protein
LDAGAPHSWQTNTVFGRLHDRIVAPRGCRGGNDLPRNRADRRRHFARVDPLPRFVALRAQDHHLVAGRHVVEAGDVHRHHVHRHRANNRHAVAPNQHRPAAAEARVEAVRVASRHNRDRPGRVGLKAPAVADALAGPADL